MLCPSCGSDVGDSVSMCQACQQTAAELPAEPASEIQTTQPAAAGPSVYTNGWGAALKQPRIIGFAGAILSLALFLVFLLLHPSNNVWQSFLLLVLFALFTISSGGWMMMWIELLHDDFMYAVICLFIFPAVYYLLIAHPERALKPFVVHIAAAAIAIPLHIYFVSVADTSAWTMLRGMLGGG